MVNDVPAKFQKPLVSFALVAFNQERWIRDAVRGAFSQTYSNMEIILSDDCSQDTTYDIMKQELANYRGPQKIAIRHNERNLGLSGHLRQLVNICQGDIVVIAAGDDISRPERVEMIVKAYRDSGGKAKSIFSNAMVINGEGQELGLWRDPHRPAPTLSLKSIAYHSSGVLGSTHAWDRTVFDTFGPLPLEVTREDAAIPFRSALLGKIVYIPEPLVYYRVHGANMGITDTLAIRDSKRYIALVGRHLRGSQALVESYMHDLCLAYTLWPERAEEFNTVKNILSSNLVDVQIEQSLFYSGICRRMQLIWQAYKEGRTRKRRLARWILWFLVPGPYLAFLKTRTRIRRLAAFQSGAERKLRFWTP